MGLKNHHETAGFSPCVFGYLFLTYSYLFELRRAPGGLLPRAVLGAAGALALLRPGPRETVHF